MVTTGADGQVRIWDLRTYKPLHAYFSPSPATWCDISQRGMLAVGWGRRVNVWKDALSNKQQSPYMSHTVQGGQLRDFHFCPYEVCVLLLPKSLGLESARLYITPSCPHCNHHNMVMHDLVKSMCLVIRPNHFPDVLVLCSRHNYAHCHTPQYCTIQF